MKFIITNARSIQPKIVSLIDYFDELKISFAMITETWLKGPSLESVTHELTHGHSLQIIAKNRPPTKDGVAVNGGGAAVVFDPTRISLKEHKIKKSNHEIIAAVGKLPNIKRKILLICAYIPPKAKSRSYLSAARLVSDAILHAKKNMNNPYVIIGGDFNRHKFGAVVEHIPDLEIHECQSMRAHTQSAHTCLLYTSPSPRDRQKSRMPSSA